MRRYFSEYLGHYKATLSLGIPLVLGQVGQIVLGFVDGAMIGQYGTNELAAASFVTNMFNLPILFGLGFSYALTPLVGQLYGRKDHLEVGSLLKNSLIANAAVGLLLSVAMYVFLQNLTSMGQPKELYPLITPYFWTNLASLIFIMLFNAFKQFADGITDTKTSMWIMLIGNAFNVLGNWVLIYGKLGLPELGLLGAGIATLTSRVRMVLIFMGAVFFTKKYTRFLVGYKRSGYSRKHHKTLNKMGVMVGLQMAMESGIFNLSTIMVGWLGSVALAAHHVAITIQTLGFMTYYGIGAATAVRVSNYYGKGDLQNVKKAATSGLHIIWLLASVLMLSLFVFRFDIATIFNNDPEVIALVVSLLIIGISYQLSDGLQVNYANALRGISEVKAMAIISFIGYFLIALPASYLLGIYWNLGIKGIWFGFPIGLTLAGVMFFLWFRRCTHASRK